MTDPKRFNPKTLFHIMIVGTIVAIIFVLVLGFGQTDIDGRRQGTIAELANVHAALRSFNLDNTRYPSTTEGLAALVSAPPGLESTWHKQIDFVPLDKWDREFIYRANAPNSATFELHSIGEDGIDGSPDDLF